MCPKTPIQDENLPSLFRKLQKNKNSPIGFRNSERKSVGIFPFRNSFDTYGARQVDLLTSSGNNHSTIQRGEIRSVQVRSRSRLRKIQPTQLIGISLERINSKDTCYANTKTSHKSTAYVVRFADIASTSRWSPRPHRDVRS